MFDTIKAKIILIALVLFMLWSAVFGAFAYLMYKDGRNLLIRVNDFNVSSLEKNIAMDVASIENTALDMALAGSIHKKQKLRDHNLAKRLIEKSMSEGKLFMGGGIWYEPYKLDPKNKFSYIYSIKNEDGKVTTKDNFNNPNFDYFNRDWYKEITHKLLTQQNRVAWSKPYYGSIGANTLMVTAGAGIYDDKNKLIGVSSVDCALASILNMVMEMKLTPNSFILFADKFNDYIFISTDPYLDNKKLLGKTLDYIPWYKPQTSNIAPFDYKGKKYISYIKNLDNGMMLIVNTPETELARASIKAVQVLITILLMITLFISWILYIILRENIAYPIEQLIRIANRISLGDINTEIKIDKPREFAKLADSFNKMAKDIHSISMEREKINSELQIAKTIQSSSLPDTFPAYPERNEFDIYARMNTATEVGGDFYDFYFIDANNFMFLVADVSGKGIPASLFMMTSKTLISTMSSQVNNPEELVEKINQKVCSINKQGMFVTLFAGILNIRNGKLTLINCGHNPPLIKRNHCEYEYLELESNMVLGVFPNFKFNIYETKMDPNEQIFLYTDGATEALNENMELYGEKRLKDIINKQNGKDIKDVVINIENDISEFAKNMPKADDITMLILEYNGSTKIYKGRADKDNYSNFDKWLDGILADWDLKEDLNMKIKLSAEELYTNVISYAYPREVDNLEVHLYKNSHTVFLKFIDWGTPYNPLNNEDPNIEENASKRKIGGLGIYMVKQSANDMKYEYTNNKNILSLEFKIT